MKDLIILAKSYNNYLVKLNKKENKCYSVDIKLKYVFGYDYAEKFMRFSCYECCDNSNISNRLKKKILNLINKSDFKAI